MGNVSQEPAAIAIRALNDLHVVDRYEPVLRAAGLDSLDALFAESVGEVLDKPGLEPWRRRLRLHLNSAGRATVLYLKRFQSPPRDARRDVRRCGTGARSVAGMEWSWMHRLAADGIDCLEPVAFGEELHSGREVRSAILTEGVPGESLEQWCRRWGPGDRATFAQVVAPLARLVGRFHAMGYVHRDLYLSHVFFCPAGRDKAALCLIDLQRMFCPRLRRLRWLVKDLAALNHSAPARLFRNVDRLRWLTRYLETSKLTVSKRALVYRIIGKTRRIERHDRKRWGGSSKAVG